MLRNNIYCEPIFDTTYSTEEIELEIATKRIKNPLNKLIFISHYFFNVKQKTICEVTGMGKTAISMRLRRLREKIKRDYEIVNNGALKP